MNSNNYNPQPSPIFQLIKFGLITWGTVELINHFTTDKEDVVEYEEEEEINQECIEVFFAHSYKYSKRYEKESKKLGKYGLCIVDNSVPKTTPLPFSSEKDLLSKLRQRIKKSKIVIVNGGDYIHSSKYMKQEIEIAKELGKKIFTIMPRSSVRTPIFLQENTKVFSSHTPRLIKEILKK